MNSRQTLRELKNRNLKKYRIIVWDQDGMIIHAIPKYLDMDWKNVRKILDKFNQYGSVEIDLLPTTNRKTLPSTKSNPIGVEKIILENELIDLEGIKEKIEAEMDLELSRNTFLRAL